jgi:hypothetical protein
MNEFNNYTSSSSNRVSVGPPIEQTSFVIDSGCTTHICTPETQLKNITPTANPINITIPDGSIMRSTHEGHLDIAELPSTATLTHVVPELHTPLISVGQLVDNGCTATIDKKTIDIKYNDKTVMTGIRSPTTALWYLKDMPHNIDKNNIFPFYANSAGFQHAAFFSPALETLYKALKLKFISNIPGFNAEMLKKYPPQSAAMVIGHLDQTRQGIRSTKTNDNDQIDTMDELFPMQLTFEDRT